MRKCAKIFSLMASLLFTMNTANALMWNDPGVNPVQSISDHRWRDANTGRLINVSGMPTPWAESAPSGTTAPSGPAPSTPDSNSSSNSSSNSNSNSNSNNSSTNRSRINARSVASGALGAVGLVSGTAGVIDSASGTDEHGWGDVLQGTISGATAAAGGAAVINAIPGLGQIGYGIAIAGGAIVGGIISGSQLFSETDCLYDPVTKQFTCCNTAFNQGERQAKIGDYMFCGQEQSDGTNTALPPGVRQCLQGDMSDKTTWSETAAGWWDGLWRDDFWQPECIVRMCDTQNAPAAGLDAYIKYTPDVQNYCWNWDCISGYRRSGNTCVLETNKQPVKPYTTPESPDENPYDALIRRLQNQRQNIITNCGYMLGTQ